MQERAEFATLQGANKRYVEKHQWPPVSYLKQVAEYERAEGRAVDPGCVVM